MKLLNYVSMATILAAIINILIVIFSDTSIVPFVSAIFAWIVVISTQLSLISVRISKR